MKTIDRIVFGTIAVALMPLALQPYLARRHMMGLAEGAPSPYVGSPWVGAFSDIFGPWEMSV